MTKPGQMCAKSTLVAPPWRQRP